MPEAVGQLEHHQVCVGQGTLDLTHPEFPDGETVEVRASVAVGQVEVVSARGDSDRSEPLR